MKFSLKKALACLLFFSSSVFAEVNIKIGDDVSILAVNGKEVDSDSFFRSKQQIELENGSNQLLIQYSTELTTAGDTELESSDTHVILFTANDTKVQLSAPKIKRLSQLKQFNKGLQWLIADQQGRSVEYQVAVLKKEGFQLGRDFERELKDFNDTDSPAALKINNNIQSTALTLLSDKTISDGVIDNKNMTGTMLKYWYMQADPETQAHFKSWMLSQ